MLAIGSLRGCLRLCFGLLLQSPIKDKPQYEREPRITDKPGDVLNIGTQGEKLCGFRRPEIIGASSDWRHRRA